MRTIELKLYNFEELDEKAKEKARDWFKKDGLEEYQIEDITESFQYKLEQLGLPTEDVRWRLSCCQGDGVAFYGEVDIEEYLKKNKIKTKFKKLFFPDGDLTISIRIDKSYNCHLYDHYNTMVLSWDEHLYGGYDNAYRNYIIDEFIEHLNSHIKELSKDFEKSGYEQIDYYNSNEYVDKNIVINEYEFTEDGEFY